MIATILLLGNPARAETSDPSSSQQTWRILLEPTFMNPPLAWKIDGAKNTVLIPVIDTPDRILGLDRKEFLKLGVNKAEFEKKAIEAASSALSQLEPRWITDKSGITIFAVLQSDNNLAASTILAPEFPALFKERIGEDLIIAIPHRDLVYIFSRQDPEYRKRSGEIIDAYRDAIYPVSLEAFTFVDGKLRAMGEFSR